MQGPRSVGLTGELREQRGANGAPSPGPRCLGAARTGASASQVHEQAQLVVDIKGRVFCAAEAHPMALALLVLLPTQSAEGGAALKLREALASIRIGDEVARLGQGPFARAHAAHGEGAGAMTRVKERLIAEMEESVCPAREARTGS